MREIRRAKLDLHVVADQTSIRALHLKGHRPESVGVRSLPVGSRVHPRRTLAQRSWRRDQHVAPAAVRLCWLCRWRLDHSDDLTLTSVPRSSAEVRTTPYLDDNVPTGGHCRMHEQAVRSAALSRGRLRPSAGCSSAAPESCLRSLTSICIRRGRAPPSRGYEGMDPPVRADGQHPTRGWRIQAASRRSRDGDADVQSGITCGTISTRMEPQMDWSLEVVVLPVSDIDRLIAFYRDQVGFHLDHDTHNEHMHVTQLTPPGSGCSIVFGDLPPHRAMEPGSMRTFSSWSLTRQPHASSCSIAASRSAS